MKEYSTRISFKNYPRIVQQKSRRTLLQQTKQIGKNVADLPTTHSRNNLSINQYSPHNGKITILKIRSVSINGERRIQQEKQATSQYLNEITKALLEKDKIINDSIRCNMFQIKFRTLALDWIIDIHYRLKLKDQTLFLFSMYFDQYCNIVQVNTQNIKSIALSCLWIAAKFQQVKCPKISTFTSIVFQMIDKQQMNFFEMDILKKLNYNLIRTTPLQILNIVLGQRRGTQQQSLSKYIFEICWIYRLTQKYEASVFVIVALKLVQHVYHQKTQYRKFKQQFSKDERTLIECFKQTCLAIQKSKNEVNITSLKSKYSKTKNHEVSKIKLQIKDPSLISI